MHPLENVAQMVLFTGQNLAYNLGFIPPDKLEWRPAPTAKSALDIMRHITLVVRSMTAVLEGRPFVGEEVPPSGTCEEAQQLIRSACQDYARAVLKIDPAALDSLVETPLGNSYTLARAANIALFDLIHHHGQIIYIQSLLGDTEDHFFHQADS